MGDWQRQRAIAARDDGEIMIRLELTEEQIDDLKEIGNVGAGYAASQLSDLIHHRCKVSIPEVLELDERGFKKTFDLGNSFAVAIYIRIHGDIRAAMIVIIKKAYAHTLVKYITRSKQDVFGKDMSYTAQTALKQMGEFLTRGYLKAVSQFLKARFKLSAPEILMETWAAVLDDILVQIGNPQEKKLIIHSSFFDPESTFDGQFFYILDQKNRDILLERVERLLMN